MRESLHDAFSPKDSVVKVPKPNKVKPGETININTAGLLELMRLPYVNQQMATDIIDYRSKNNGFKNVEELMNIKGIKQKRLEKMRPYVKLE